MKDLTVILDNCIERIARGETLAGVLSDYPDERDQLEPLIRMSMKLVEMPKVKPSSEFVNTSKTSLMRKIYCDRAKAKSKAEAGIPGKLNRFFEGLVSKRRLTVAISAITVAVLVLTIGQFTFMKPSPAYAAECFLRILSGDVSVMTEGNDSYTVGTDGMSLKTGTMIKTEADSHALLAFFDGSTIKLDPDTTLEIIEMSGQDEQSRTIILKQWLGRTWSRVEKMIDADSQYEIETPSAMAVVRGTLFATEVADNGSTAVETTRGLVSVFGEDEEVFVPANQKTEVARGTTPSQPTEIPVPLTQIVITIEGPAAGSINDPSGSSTGNFPDGLEFNQIPGSITTVSPEGYQVITITEPANGNYNLTLRYLEEGSATYHIQGMSGNETVFDFPGIIDGENEKGSIINFNLKSTGKDLDIGTVTVKALGKNNAPEKTVSQNEFSGGQETDTIPAQNNSNGSGQGKNTADNTSSSENGTPANEEKKDGTGNDKDTGNSNSNGNGNKTTDSDETNDTTVNGNSQKKDKTETDEDVTDTESSSEKGNSEDKGNSSSSGNDKKDSTDNSKSSSGNGNSGNNGNGNGNSKTDETSEEDTDEDTTAEDEDTGNGNGNGNSSSSDKENNGNGNSKDAEEKTNGKSNSNGKNKSDTTDNTTSGNATATSFTNNSTLTTYTLDSTE